MSEKYNLQIVTSPKNTDNPTNLNQEASVFTGIYESEAAMPVLDILILKSGNNIRPTTDLYCKPIDAPYIM